jgi:hypothetical protein
MSERLSKTIVETIDVTPTWSGVLPLLLLVLREGTTAQARKAAEDELKRMAHLADVAVEMLKKDDPAS